MIRSMLALVVIISILGGVAGACATVDTGGGGGIGNGALDMPDGGEPDLHPPGVDLWRICEPDFEGFTSTGDPDAFCKGKPDGNAFEQLKDGCTPFYLVNGQGERVASPVCCAGLTCVPPAMRPGDGGLCLWRCM